MQLREDAQAAADNLGQLDRMLYLMEQFSRYKAAFVENGMGGLGKYSPGNLLQDEEGGRTWEEFFGQGAMSIGNMVPSMAVAGMIGMAAPALGAGAALTKGLSRAGSLAVMGAGIAGNTYAEAINQGYSPKNAKAYAYANAASEILTEVAFGGIEGMTGIGTDALVEKLLSTTDNGNSVKRHHKGTKGKEC